MAIFDILFSPHSIIDIEDAVSYYNEKLQGLGAVFLNQVQSTLRKISENPYIYAWRYENIRCANVWKFPFLVHFQIDDGLKQILILAIYNTHQEPLWEK